MTPSRGVFCLTYKVGILESLVALWLGAKTIAFLLMSG